MFTNLRTQLQHLLCNIAVIVTVKSVRVIMSNGVKQQMLWVCLHYLIFLIPLVNPALKPISTDKLLAMSLRQALALGVLFM